MYNFTGKSYIGSKPAASGTRSFQAFNPSANRFIEGPFFEATEEEMNSIMELADQAFTTYCNTQPKERALFLEAIAEEIMAAGEDLIARCVAESGLPEGRITGERARTVGQLQLFAATIRRGDYVQARIDRGIADRKPLPKPDIRRMLIPVGPVLVFGASNFPLAFSTAGGDTASALAAGCPVIVKGHPAHPGTSEIVSRAILRAAEKTHMPNGVFSMFYADHGLAIQAVEHPLVRAVGFTGSRQAGMTIFKAAMNRRIPIPVYAEMSAVNPVIILPGAIEEKGDAIAEGLAASMTLGVGQFCTNPGIIFLLNNEGTGSFLQKLAGKIETSLPGTMLSAGICQNFRTGVESLKKIPGVTALAASAADADVNRNQGAPVLFQVAAEQFIRDERLQGEVFGPSSIVVLCQTFEELEKALACMEGQLTATVHAGSGEFESVQRLLPLMTLKAGRLLFNGFPTGVEVCASQQHGGPFPATTDARNTSVGTAAMDRFLRPVAFQHFPDALLPDALKEENPLHVLRLLDDQYVCP